MSNVCAGIEKLMDILLKKYETPLATGEHPEIDDTGLLDSDGHSKYRMLIGCGQWSITLGRFDVMFAIQPHGKMFCCPQGRSFNQDAMCFWIFERLPDIWNHY